MSAPLEKPPDSDLQNSSPRFGAKAIAFVCLLAALVFAALWLTDRPRTQIVSVEKVKEVPVERVKEIPVERVKEVPVELTADEKTFMDVGKRMLNRPRASPDDILYNIPAFAVRIIIADEAKPSVSEERLKNKTELILRNSRIKLMDSAPVRIVLSLDAFWIGELKLQAVYTLEFNVYDDVTLTRDGDLRHAVVSIYNDSRYGIATKAALEKAIVDYAEEISEKFANKYLATQEKESQRHSSQ